MKLFKAEQYVNMKNPVPGKAYRPQILTAADNARDMGGQFCLNEPGSETTFHVHKNNETVRIIMSGECTHVTLTDDGDIVETPMKAGDVLFIPANEKHRLVNKDARFLEFFTNPPVVSYRD
jgi:oxalate decarboxylase/phosphoglucose isomerase-like protein (cupin superfamily)